MLCQKNTRLGATAALAGLILAATACSSGTAASPAAAPGTAAPSSNVRLAVSSPGSVSVLDGTTLEVIETFDSEEFTRLNAAGDGRHVFVTTSSGFQLLDAASPALTDVTVAATAAGHVVRHAGNTVLYDDGNGTTTIVKTKDMATLKDSPPESASHTAESPHHGVSIVLADGTLVTTLGDKASRPGAVALEPHDGHWHAIAESRECPGIHGEGTAMNEAVVFGCEDGALLYQDGKFEKFTAPDQYGRMGNAYVSETSPIVVGDYKNDPDAEGYLLNAVALIDTEKRSYTVADLPDTVQYTFRDVARGPGDLAYILATDGSIHVLDPQTGRIVKEFPVVKAWEGPKEWQEAHPAIAVHGNTAFVTEPAVNTIHTVDLTTGKILVSRKLDAAPNEMAIITGAP